MSKKIIKNWFDKDRKENPELQTTYQTNAVCPKCGRYLHTTDIYGYSFVCMECNENFFTIEVSSVQSDTLEIEIPISEKKYIRVNNKLKKLAAEYKCSFLGYDAECNIMDIGWDVSHIPDNDVLYRVALELNSIL